MWKSFRFAVNIRGYSIKHATKDPVKYTNTINLPKTKFPGRLSVTKRSELEGTLTKSAFTSSYDYQLDHNREPAFVLHDGPPYANGDLHMGHAVNKILKDITIRNRAVRGQKVHYVPGWDCHGLPIELKASTTGKDKGPNTLVQNPVEIRGKSRQFAAAAIERQKDDFRSWGILADWKNPYFTYSPEFIVNELQLFINLYERDLVYRDLKPVYWSPSSGTALAEAELEYDHNFVSPSVYVRFELKKAPIIADSLQQPSTDGKLYALVWTTTPWTLPSNQAIAYNKTLEYSIVNLSTENSNSNLYLIASDLLNAFSAETGIECVEVKRIPGSVLTDCQYIHPIWSEQQQQLPFYAAGHVQNTKGTGLVHTAPAHGPDDFLVSLEHKFPVNCFVNGAGVYTSDAPEFLRGRCVLNEGDRLVLEHIASDIVHRGTLTHAYPIDWRTKQPVIIRASEQWFINTERLKSRALEEIERVEIYPRINAGASRRALATQVQKRPYWCISRQRVWGVPIPVFYERNSGKVITNRAIVDHVCKLVKEKGNIDFWWSQKDMDLLPIELVEGTTNLTKGTDIFDIWFDSGSTWSHTLPNSQIADLYLEGYDQFTGWFQSSLLMSVAARDCAPYRALFVHGFTVDENGHKMSKSLGNVISPKDVTNKYGMDVLRWWVASHGTQHMSITVSDKLLQQSADNLSRIRATIRYLNGVVGQRRIEIGKNSKPKFCLNRYLLSSLVGFEQEITRSYDAYEYNRVTSNILNFVANDISALYVHLVKDRLYCGNAEEIQEVRDTAQHCYELLCKVLWPLTPFLVEESWSHFVDKHNFHCELIASDSTWKSQHIEDVVNCAIRLKRAMNQNMQNTNTWTLSVCVTCSDEEQLKLLQELQPMLNVPFNNSELCELLQVQSVTLMKAKDSTVSISPFCIEFKQLESVLCPRCRRFAVDKDGCLCSRCSNVLQIKGEKY